MKYWLFQSNQVIGPFEAEILSEQPGFSAESLVCPEGRKGTQMGDWQRAGIVAELAELLLRQAKVSAGVGGGSFMTGGNLLPPEPTLRDLAILGTLQEKVSLLEASLTQYQEELHRRDTEISSLKSKLDERGDETARLRERLDGISSDVQSRIDGIEGRLSGTESLREEVARTKKEQENENKLIGELHSQLEIVRAGIQEDKTVSDASSFSQPLPEPLPSGISIPGPTMAGGFEEMRRPLEDIPVVNPPPSDENSYFRGPELVQSDPPPITLAPPVPAPESLPSLEPIDSIFTNADGDLPKTLTGSSLESPADLNPVQDEPVVDLSAPTSSLPKPPARSKKPLVFAALAAFVALLVGGAFLAAKSGALAPLVKKLPKPLAALAAPYLVKKKAAPKPFPEPLAAPAEAPESAPARAPEPDRTNEAIELVKNYPVGQKGLTLAGTLESERSVKTLLEPWSAENLGQGRFKVSFYSKPGDGASYQFEVSLNDRRVIPLNALSKQALEGVLSPSLQASAEGKPRKRRGGASRRREVATPVAAPEEPKTQDPVEAVLSAPPAEPRRRVRRKAAEPRIVEQDSATAPQPAAQKTEEELTLDELLLPGVPKRP